MNLTDKQIISEIRERYKKLLNFNRRKRKKFVTGFEEKSLNLMRILSSRKSFPLASGDLECTFQPKINKWKNKNRNKNKQPIGTYLYNQPTRSSIERSKSNSRSKDRINWQDTASKSKYNLIYEHFKIILKWIYMLIHFSKWIYTQVLWSKLDSSSK